MRHGWEMKMVSCVSTKWATLQPSGDQNTFSEAKPVCQEVRIILNLSSTKKKITNVSEKIQVKFRGETNANLSYNKELLRENKF